MINDNVSFTTWLYPSCRADVLLVGFQVLKVDTLTYLYKSGTKVWRASLYSVADLGLIQLPDKLDMHQQCHSAEAQDNFAPPCMLNWSYCQYCQEMKFNWTCKWNDLVFVTFNRNPISCFIEKPAHWDVNVFDDDSTLINQKICSPFDHILFAIKINFLFKSL
jgi:hypothetical protein